MPTMIDSKVSVKRVADLIEAYGSNTESWPEKERHAAVACLDASPLLKQQLRDAAHLDAMLLEGYVEEPVDETLLKRIVNNLPPQPGIHRAERETARARWSAALVAAVTGIAIMLVVMNSPIEEVQPEQVAVQELDYWLWEEVTDQVSFDNSEETTTELMNML